MSSPPVGLVLLGGLVVAPLVGATCAWVGQRRYRRAMALRLKKPASAVVALPVDERLRLALVLGIAGSVLSTLATLPDGRAGGIAMRDILLRWVGLAGVIAALVAAVRLARVGMPPEPNFRLDEGVGGELLGKSGVPAGAADLLDAREL